MLRDEQTIEVYLPLTSQVVLERKHEKLYVPLDFGNKLTVDALVELGAYVSAIAQNDLDTINQKAPSIIRQKGRYSQFSNTRSKWPVTETASNSRT